MLYIYKDDLRSFNFNVFTERYTYDWAGTAFIIAMMGQGLNNLIVYCLSHNAPLNLSMQLFYVPVIPLFSVVAAPILEETIFRRIIFGYLDRKYDFYTGAVISSLLFAIAHLDMRLVPGYFLVGMTFCWVYKKSGTIATTIIAHTYMNFLVVIVSSLKTNIHIN